MTASLAGFSRSEPRSQRTGRHSQSLIVASYFTAAASVGSGGSAFDTHVPRSAAIDDSAKEVVAGLLDQFGWDLDEKGRE